ERVPTPEWLRFRYDSTTDWLRRACEAVKRANPRIRTDSLICVTPLCSDLWYGPGIAWDRAGYEAGLEYATTDPYIILHNYLGDSTHWYVTETAEHLAAAGPQRRCGIVLEGSRLRKEHRELDPVEIYGSALSAVWHGADELAFFHRVHVTGASGVTARPEVSQASIRGLYSLLAKIDPWLDGLAPKPGVALLFSRASCDAWRMWLGRKDAEPPFETHGVTDPRFASIAQREVLYTLLRIGVPTTVYYLDSVSRAELDRHATVVVPFPLAVSEGQGAMLERLADGGKRVIILGADGPLDPSGTPHAKPVLEALCARAEREPGGPIRALGGSRDVFRVLAGDRSSQKRTRVERILPGMLNGHLAIVLGATGALDTSAVAEASILPRLGRPDPKTDDLEIALSVNRRGEGLLLAINWANREQAIELSKRPCFDQPPHEAYLLGPDGSWSPWRGRLRPELTLKGQQVLVARLAGQ
ncbi:MAG: hypothetical protein ACODAJ_16950, partial [Planctomycetota bacterium]